MCSLSVWLNCLLFHLLTQQSLQLSHGAYLKFIIVIELDFSIRIPPSPPWRALKPKGFRALLQFSGSN